MKGGRGREVRREGDRGGGGRRKGNREGCSAVVSVEACSVVYAWCVVESYVCVCACAYIQVALIISHEAFYGLSA